MKNQRGFIQIPLLISIIVGALVMSGAGYVGVRQYQDYQAKKIEKEKMIQEKEKEVQEATQAQQKALQKAQQEIEKLKTESEQSKNQQKALERKINQEELKPKDITITASELVPYLSGVVEIDCGFAKGSGSLWTLGGNDHVVLTNAHVVEQTTADGSCVIFSRNAEGEFEGIYQVKPADDVILSNIDVAILKITPARPDLTTEIFIKRIADLNYKISSLPACVSSMQIGLPVILVGYPKFGKTETEIQGAQGTFSSRISTNGIISSYTPKIQLKYSNYFISAKIDSGNSGGIAFSKDDKGLCVLGIPTWLTLGNYETQGLVQNIHNVMYGQ